jgi:hypothetical protein
MTEDEAKQVLKRMGWTALIRTRRQRGTRYLYALRKIRGKLIECYIAPLSKLPELTEADIVAKLTRRMENLRQE